MTHLKGSGPIGSQQSRQELTRTLYPQIFVGCDEGVETKVPGQQGHKKQKETGYDILFDGSALARH
jgi:hypothetical protein